MQKLILQSFGRYRETLVEALRCEDYEEQGILDLAQLHEAISTVDEDLDVSVLNYMLYYVLIRSVDHENMQYQYLISLLDSLIQTQSRSQSASRKNRPESSSPDKLKLRNKAKSNLSQADKDDEED